MKVGDLVRLAGTVELGLIIAISPLLVEETNIFGDWYKCIILWAHGHIGWEYDIDLEMKYENR